MDSARVAWLKEWAARKGYPVCTADAPQPNNKRAAHPDATYVEDVDHDYGTCAVYRCDHCGYLEHDELPQ